MDRPVQIDQEHARQPATQGAERLRWTDLDDQQLGLLAPQARVGLDTGHQCGIARLSFGQEQMTSAVRPLWSQEWTHPPSGLGSVKAGSSPMPPIPPERAMPEQCGTPADGRPGRKAAPTRPAGLLSQVLAMRMGETRRGAIRRLLRVG